MSFTPEQKKLLDAKLDAKNVKSRSQAGRSLSYIEGWHAIAEANRIFGHDGWTRETLHLQCVWTGDVNGKPACTYIAKVRIKAGGVERDGTGAGHGVAKSMGDAHESAIKEAETDATKRALMTFGWPFGLALYDKDQEHVDDGTAAAPPPKVSQAFKGFHLVNPADPKDITVHERGSAFLDALWDAMSAAKDPASWWAVNGSVAKDIAERFPQAKPKVDAMEQLALTKAA